MADKICFEINDPAIFRRKMLNWANRFSIFCYLDGNGYPADRSFPVLLAAGAKRSVSLKAGNAFEVLKEFHQVHPSWIFGHLGYSMMKETEGVDCRHSAFPDFGDGFFFEPEILLSLEGNSLGIYSSLPADELYNEILATAEAVESFASVSIRHFMSRDAYLLAVRSIQEHIRLGDCYELNYCQAFDAEDVRIDPVAVFLRLMEVSPNPFAALYRLHDNYCICASPERFIKKSGNQVISQPMKGTAPRHHDREEDARNLAMLRDSNKELSENVMIVDLVRNDLSKCCKAGSVEVEELFGLYSFPLVHQMISTVKGVLAEGVHWSEMIKNSFPMGSMTGAPKKRVLELIAAHEKTGRGLFSGSIGYVDPSGDLDMNVVIRSIFYDSHSGKLRFLTGGGITFYSDPEKEYEESMLKAAAMIRVLENS